MHTPAAEHVEIPDTEGCIPFFGTNKEESTLSIIVVGASGELARKKIFPALFALFYEERLPLVRFTIYSILQHRSRHYFLF